MKTVFGKRVYFSKLKDKAILPRKKDEDAGYDLYACFDEDFMLFDEFETRLVPTGIAWACSKSFYMQFHERSSTGSKGIKVNGGVIDSGYRGEFKVALFNATRKKLVLSNLGQDKLLEKYPEFADQEKFLIYSCEKAIAEGLIHKNHKMKIKEIPYDKLKQFVSERKEGGFGSTNKKA